jgi:hypothetical protein
MFDVFKYVGDEDGTRRRGGRPTRMASEKLLMRLGRLGEETKGFIARVAGVDAWRVIENHEGNPVLTNDDMRNLEDVFRRLALWDDSRFEQLFPEGSEEESPDERRAGRKDGKVEDHGLIQDVTSSVTA